MHCQFLRGIERDEILFTALSRMKLYHSCLNPKQVKVDVKVFGAWTKWYTIVNVVVACIVRTYSFSRSRTQYVVLIVVDTILYSQVILNMWSKTNQDVVTNGSLVAFCAIALTIFFVTYGRKVTESLRGMTGRSDRVSLFRKVLLM